MRSLFCAVLVGVLLAGATIGADDGRGRNHRRDRSHDRHDRDRHDRRADARYDRRGYDRRDRYFSVREVRVMREYYGPRYRPLPHGVRRHHYRQAYLPADWHRCVEPIPAYLERELVVLPHGYHRGILDGQVIVYNSRGLIIDVAVLF